MLNKYGVNVSIGRWKSQETCSGCWPNIITLILLNSMVNNSPQTLLTSPTFTASPQLVRFILNILRWLRNSSCKDLVQKEEEEWKEIVQYPFEAQEPQQDSEKEKEFAIKLVPFSALSKQRGEQSCQDREEHDPLKGRSEKNRSQTPSQTSCLHLHQQNCQEGWTKVRVWYWFNSKIYNKRFQFLIYIY